MSVLRRSEKDPYCSRNQGCVLDGTWEWSLSFAEAVLLLTRLTGQQGWETKGLIHPHSWKCGEVILNNHTLLLVFNQLLGMPYMNYSRWN